MTAAENYMQPFWLRRKEDLITAFTVVEQRLGDIALKAMDQLILPIDSAMAEDYEEEAAYEQNPTA